MENSLEVAAVQTIVVRKIKEAPVPRTSVGKISLMMIYIYRESKVNHTEDRGLEDTPIMKNII